MSINFWVVFFIARHVFLPSGSLQIARVTASEQGVYQCSAVNTVIGNSVPSPVSFRLRITGKSLSKVVLRRVLPCNDLIGTTGRSTLAIVVLDGSDSHVTQSFQSSDLNRYTISIDVFYRFEVENKFCGLRQGR